MEEEDGGTPLTDTHNEDERGLRSLPLSLPPRFSLSGTPRPHSMYRATEALLHIPSSRRPLSAPAVGRDLYSNGQDVSLEAKET
jgi:hypothetical protein